MSERVLPRYVLQGARRSMNPSLCSDQSTLAVDNPEDTTVLTADGRSELRQCLPPSFTDATTRPFRC